MRLAKRAATKIQGVPRLACLRCPHKWIPRRAELPMRCPKCGSPYWDRPVTLKRGVSNG